MEKPNLDYFKQISGGDIEFENNLLSILKLEFPVEFIVLKKNFENNFFKEVSLNIHKIKPKIGMLGMMKSLELATKCETNIKEGNTEQFKDLVLVLDRINVYLDRN